MPSTCARQLPQSPARHSVPPPAGASPARRIAIATESPAANGDRPTVDDDASRLDDLADPRRVGHWRIRRPWRVEQRLGLEPGRPAPPDDLDLEAVAARAVRRRAARSARSRARSTALTWWP